MANRRSLGFIRTGLAALLVMASLAHESRPAMAGASTGTWKYYPNGVYPGYGGPRGYGHGYGVPNYGYGRPAYGYGRPAYGYGRPVYGYGRPAYDYYEPYGQQQNDAGAALAAGMIGLAAGAILGGALSQHRPVASCSQYRTYDPRTGTYVGRGGVRYPCR